MKLTVQDGDRTVTIEDARPVVDADLLKDLLAAVGGESEGVTVSLPFGFTAVAEDEEDAEPEAVGG